MRQTSSEIVTRCLEFNYPERIPQDVWILPWFTSRYPHVSNNLIKIFKSDIEFAANVYNPSEKIKSDPYAEGIFVDEWGCEFRNIQPGIIGEVKSPMVKDISEWQVVQPPYEILPDNKSKARDDVNLHCAKSDKFIIGPGALIKQNPQPPFKSYFNFARPWERYQFLRGTENAMMDLLDFNRNHRNLLKRIHDYFLKELEFWVSTDIDAIWFMDDWGAQNQLLIPPQIWKDIFKPLYRDYCDLAHSNDKFVFMHSDGCIIDIYDDLIEIGVNAVNSQIFCMDMKQLQKYKGRITFWGEIDRQHVMPDLNPQKGQQAVRQVMEFLYDPAGGVIAQFEVGPGANPDTVEAVAKEWLKIQEEITLNKK